MSIGKWEIKYLNGIDMMTTKSKHFEVALIDARKQSKIDSVRKPFDSRLICHLPN